MLFEWFKQARAKNIPVSGPLLQEKATIYAAKLVFDKFKASNGLLERRETKQSDETPSNPVPHPIPTYLHTDLRVTLKHKS